MRRFALTLAVSTLLLVRFAYGLSQDSVDGSRTVFLTPTPRVQNVPEPSALVLLGMGALGLAVCARRRRRVA